MNRDLPILIALLVAALLPPQLWQNLATPDRVSGVVVSVSARDRSLAVRTADGQAWQAQAGEGAAVLVRRRGGPALAALESISVGDQVSIRGEINTAARAVVARSLLVTRAR